MLLGIPSEYFRSHQKSRAVDGVNLGFCIIDNDLVGSYTHF